MKPNDDVMLNFELEAHSFLVRLWQEHEGVPASQPEWRGWVEHVQTGQRHYFQDAQTLGAAFQSYIENVPNFEELLTSLIKKRERLDDGQGLQPFS